MEHVPFVGRKEDSSTLPNIIYDVEMLMYRLYIFIPTQFYHIFHIVLEIHMSSSYISIDVSTLIYM